MSLEHGKEIMISLDKYLERISKDSNPHEITAICVRKAGIDGDIYKGSVFFTQRLLSDTYTE